MFQIPLTPRRRQPGVLTLIALTAEVCLCLIAPSARAQAAEPTQAQTPAALEKATPVLLLPSEEADLSAMDAEAQSQAFSFYAGTNFVSAYISRGQVFSSKFSIQPWFEIDVPLSSGEPIGPFRSLSVFFGNWNSIQEGDPGLGQARTGNLRQLDNWYEADLYAGLRAKLGEHWQTSLRFNYYTSPSDSFADIHEIDWRVRYDDAAFWADRGMPGFSTRPSLRVAKETRDGGGPEQWYFSPALHPSFNLNLGDLPVTVTTPLILGFGADGQYFDADGDEIHFGFFQTGLTLSAPLDLLPDHAGTLSISGGFDAIFVTDEAINFRGNDVEIVGKFGLTYTY